MNDQMYIVVDSAYKSYDEGRIQALRGAHLEVEKGEFVAIMGPSGCGKSTLLHMIGALDTPDKGEVYIEGEALSLHADVSRFRSQTVGFVFQLHNLIPSLTALENIEIPLFESGMSSYARRERGKELLELVGLEGRMHNVPNTLSGGERQRVALARALAQSPPIILADEPTGSLDSQSAGRVLDLLRDVHERLGGTVIMVTHDSGVAEHADRIVRMLDGKVV